MIGRRHHAMAAALSALLLAAPPALAQSSPSPSETANLLREMKDRAEIEKLMWDYVAGIDGWNPDAYAASFTEDGAFGRTKGREALRQMVVDLKKSQDDRRAAGNEPGNMHHIMSNMNIEFVTPDHAKVYYYWQTVFGGGAGTTPPVRVAAVGRGLDDVVRVNGKWLIQNRNVSYQHPGPEGS